MPSILNLFFLEECPEIISTDDLEISRIVAKTVMRAEFALPPLAGALTEILRLLRQSLIPEIPFLLAEGCTITSIINAPSRVGWIHSETSIVTTNKALALPTSKRWVIKPLIRQFTAVGQREYIGRRRHRLHHSL